MFTLNSSLFCVGYETFRSNSSLFLSKLSRSRLKTPIKLKLKLTLNLSWSKPSRLRLKVTFKLKMIILVRDWTNNQIKIRSFQHFSFPIKIKQKDQNRFTFVFPIKSRLKRNQKEIGPGDCQRLDCRQSKVYSSYKRLAVVQTFWKVLFILHWTKFFFEKWRTTPKIFGQLACRTFWSLPLLFEFSCSEKTQ